MLLAGIRRISKNCPQSCSLLVNIHRTFFPGLVSTLNGLNLTGNPLEFPPVDILERGTSEVLKFLKEMLIAKSTGKLPMDSKYNCFMK